MRGHLEQQCHNMIIFQEDFQNVDLKRKIQFVKIIIQNASLEELEEINNVISQISNRINK